MQTPENPVDQTHICSIRILSFTQRKTIIYVTTAEFARRSFSVLPCTSINSAINTVEVYLKLGSERLIGLGEISVGTVEILNLNDEFLLLRLVFLLEAT